MTSLENNPTQIIQNNHWRSLLVFVLLFIVSNVLSQLIGAFAAVLVAEVPFSQLEQVFAPPYTEKSKYVLYVAQGLSHLLGFTIFSLVFIKKVDGQGLSIHFNKKRFNLNAALLVVGITFSFMLFNSIVIEWNMNINFPEFLSGFEQWARSTEDQLLALTTMLSSYANIGEMFVALIVIGVFPAIGEELVFRGLLQNKLYAIAKNPHIAIWVAAIIFGAFHLQFYGVVPRIFLGALFGYLYFYSGNIWYPIIAHFVNNGLAVIIMYIGPLVDDNWDPNTVDTEMPIYMSLIAIVVCVLLGRKFFTNMKATENV
jgi:hypothetical protein